MSNKERVDVFISSTSIDLPLHRQKIIEILNLLHFQPIGMEYWGATGEKSLDLCKKHVCEADIFIGIYAHRYGWCPDGETEKSITELEFDWAVERSIPRLCFCMDQRHLITIDTIEFEKRGKLEAFKKRISQFHINYFSSIDDLGIKVMAALVPFLPIVSSNSLSVSLPSLSQQKLDIQHVNYTESVQPSSSVQDKWIIIYLQKSGDAEKDRRRLRRLHGIITSYPGPDRFSVVVEDTDQSFRMEFPNDTTLFCNDLVHDLITIVGDEGNIEIFEIPK